MARYTGPVCRLCRRERTKLFLKGERCYSMKCPVSEAVTDRHSRAYPPGEHGRDRMRQGSEYLGQLREKQKARRIYGLLERQFHNLYVEASKAPGITGENLLRMLELRLDNVTFRAGWGASRAQARQFVRHGHVLVNGKRVTIPSYRVREGDVISLKPSSRELFHVRRNMDTLDRQLPPWLETVGDKFEVRVFSLPSGSTSTSQSRSSSSSSSIPSSTTSTRTPAPHRQRPDTRPPIPSPRTTLPRSHDQHAHHPTTNRRVDRRRREQPPAVRRGPARPRLRPHARELPPAAPSCPRSRAHRSPRSGSTKPSTDSPPCPG